MLRLLGFTGLVGCLLAGCGASAGVGVGIPGTPISIGASVPLDQRGRKAKDTRYLQIPVDTVPTGAEVWVDGILVGSTPMNASLPFDKGFWGSADGSVQVTFKKLGYLPEGVRLFAVDGNRISSAPEGKPIGKLEATLRWGQ